MFSGFFAVVAFVTMAASQSFAQSVTTLSFFEDSLLVDVVFPKVLSTDSKQDNVFIVQVKDFDGNPWSQITTEWAKFTIEMPGMSHGVQEVKDVKDVLDANRNFQGRLAVTPKFRMKDIWQLNITLIVANPNPPPNAKPEDLTIKETKSVQFRVN